MAGHTPGPQGEDRLRPSVLVPQPCGGRNGRHRARRDMLIHAQSWALEPSHGGRPGAVLDPDTP